MSRCTQTPVDYSAIAQEAQLIYVSDANEGISRQRHSKDFKFYYKDLEVTNPVTIDRIKKLVLPPAWENVWICAKANGHLQATGYDTKNRKQYKYHTDWNKISNETKFHKLNAFGKVLPVLRQQIEKDLRHSALDKEKVLATVVYLMEQTAIRVGNSAYEKLYRSYGLTTMKDGHVRIEAGEIKFSFKGKKGVAHNISIKNKRLARIVKACRDIPGKELFQYYNKEGSRCTIDSGMVNDYIRNATGQDFSAKDFRTWAGSVSMITALKNFDKAQSLAEQKRQVVKALDEVSKRLGNTRTVCKKYYVHPAIIELFEDDKLAPYVKQLSVTMESNSVFDLTATEKILIKILNRRLSGKNKQFKSTLAVKSALAA